MRFTVHQTMVLFAILGIADLVVAIIRYPAPLQNILDLIQMLLGMVSVLGFVLTPIIYEDEKK